MKCANWSGNSHAQIHVYMRTCTHVAVPKKYFHASRAHDVKKDSTHTCAHQMYVHSKYCCIAATSVELQGNQHTSILHAYIYTCKSALDMHTYTHTLTYIHVYTNITDLHALIAAAPMTNLVTILHNIIAYEFGKDKKPFCA